MCVCISIYIYIYMYIYIIVIIVCITHFVNVELRPPGPRAVWIKAGP